MKWITASNLEDWSKRIAARVTFPGLIGDLIRASASQISAFRFPSGDKGQVRGFDGWLIADGCAPYIPVGTSIWEFGITSDAGKKFIDDLKSRTKKIGIKDRSTYTFVFASLHTWDHSKKNLQIFVAAAAKGKGWKNVVYLDGVQLEHWLDNCPAVASRYARNELLSSPPLGAISADEFWDEYSNRFEPQLSEDVLLCGRHSEADELVRNLLSSSGSVRLAADSPDEVVAFAVAAIRKADVPVRAFLEARTLIVESVEAARFLANLSNLVFFPRGQTSNFSGMLATKGPTLLAAGGDQSTSNHKYLARPSTNEFAKALETMGINDREAAALAHKCGRSITILARQIAKGNFLPPKWVGSAVDILPAIFAGGWDSLRVADQEAVAGLIVNRDYKALEAKLRTCIKMQDPPIDRVGQIWKIIAPVDAFVNIGHLVSRDELIRLDEVVTRVFSQVVEPPGDDELYSVKTKDEGRYSAWLRDGLATTLLLFAALHRQAEVNVAGVEPQNWVDNLIERLPGLSKHPRLMASLRDEFPVLMEAAPNPLLSALEQLLGGKDDFGREFFWNRDAMFGPTSPHVYLLWALERLAWDPQQLPRITLILGKLTEFNMNSSSGNKPIGSLRSIYLPWNPNTFATLVQRMAALDLLIRNNPNAGWLLAVELLPKSHDSNVPTTKPRFRESNASEAELLTHGLVRKGREEIVERVLKLAEGDSTRLMVVIDSMYHWDGERFARALQMINKFLSSSEGAEFDNVWSALRDLANKHRTFAHTDWAISAASLAEVDQIIKKHEPENSLTRLTWLFDDWSPNLPGPLEKREKLAVTERIAAVREIFSDHGVSGIFQLVEVAKYTHFVAEAVGEELLKKPEDFISYVSQSVDKGGANVEHFALALSAQANQKFPAKWKDIFRNTVIEKKWPERVVAKLMLAWADELATWEFVDSFGAEVTKEYWTHKRALPFRCGLEAALKGAECYLAFGRPSAALLSLHGLLSEIPSQTLLGILGDLVGELNRNDNAVDSMMQYYIEEAFEELGKRNDVKPEVVARREYSYLPILNERNRQLTIHRILASDPDFYVSLICSVFRSDDDDSHDQSDAEDSSEMKRAKWRSDYMLLGDFKTIPGGTDTGIEFEVLRTWVTRVRELATKEKRSAITDQYIGHILAHSPDGKNDLWPHESICRLIEELEADELERGFANECFNKRGVYSKGMFEGGKKERQLAEQYRFWSKAAVHFPRTSAMLENIAKNWERDAEGEDLRAEQDKLKY